MSPSNLPNDQKNGPSSIPCQRCGDFSPHRRLEFLFGKRVCPGCVESFAIDEIDQFKAKLWGQRELFLNCVGLGGVLVSLFSALALSSAASDLLSLGGVVAVEAIALLALLGLSALSLVAFVGYLSLAAWSRPSLAVLLLLSLLSFALLVLLGLGSVLEIAIPSFCLLSPALLMGALGQWSPRNQLAFRQDISDEDLVQLYQHLSGNPEARLGLVLGLLGWGCPLLFPISFLLSLRGISQCDPEAWPPIEEGGKAWLGMALSISGLLAWGCYLLIGSYF